MMKKNLELGSNQNRRMSREKKTADAMIRLYCSGQHGTRSGLCADCREVSDYAMKRLEKCPFQERKTTCGNCRVHCYKPAMREKIREVMRYAGPRMIYRHPLLAFFHLLDGFRKEPVRKMKQE